MKTSGMDIRNHKKRGHWAELRFMTKATELGFQVAQPLGDAAPYDVVLDVGGHFISVQVKSTFFSASNLKPGNFVASLFHGNGPDRTYQRSDFDYLAVYYIPKDIWYIIPSAEAAGASPSGPFPATNKTNGNPTAKLGIFSTTAPPPHSKSPAASTSTALSRTTMSRRPE